MVCPMMWNNVPVYFLGCCHVKQAGLCAWRGENLMSDKGNCGVGVASISSWGVGEGVLMDMEQR